MSETVRHSPGPWAARRNNSYWQIDAGDFGQIGDACASSCSEEYGGSEALGEANARMMAAAPDQNAALVGLEQFFERPGENSIERFERIAMQFYRETGMMAPGKDAPAAGSQGEPEERRAAYDAWVSSKVEAARAALSKATVAPAQSLIQAQPD